MPWQDEATALPTAGGSGCTTGAAALPSEEQLLGIYAELAAQGFQRRHVEGALGALPLPAITLETALDCECRRCGLCEACTCRARRA